MRSSFDDMYSLKEWRMLDWWDYNLRMQIITLHQGEVVVYIK